MARGYCACSSCAFCSIGILNYDSRVTSRLKLASAGHFFVISLLIGAFAVPSSAQGTNHVANLPFSPAPYKAGERLTYSVSFSNFVSAAHIEILVAGRGTLAGREGIMLKSHVETIGT